MIEFTADDVIAAFRVSDCRRANRIRRIAISLHVRLTNTYITRDFIQSR